MRKGKFDPLTIALLAGGGLLVYKKLKEPSWDPVAWVRGLFSGRAGVATSPAAPGQQAEQQAAQAEADVKQAARATTIALMAQQAVVHNFEPTSTYDEWNWLYRDVRGVDGPDFGMVMGGADRGLRMSMDEYWAYVVASGLGRLYAVHGLN